MKFWKVEIITKGKENLIGRDFLVYTDTKDNALQIVINDIYKGNKESIITADVTNVTEDYIDTIIEGY